MLSGRSKKEYAKEAQTIATAPDGEPAPNGAGVEGDLETAIAM
jgi:hypothetical protein